MNFYRAILCTALLHSYVTIWFTLESNWENLEQLYYVYIGKNLPQYGASAIKLASTFSGMKLNLIGNEALRKSLTSLPINFIALEDLAINFFNFQLDYISKRNLIVKFFTTPQT